MKKYLIFASVLLFAASCAKQPAQVINYPDAHELGQAVTLKKGESVSFNNSDVSLKLTDFYYHPCPQGSQCFWSGLDVFYELSAGGQVYKKDGIGAPPANMPYDVQVKDSDYQTSASFIVTKKTSTETLNSYTSPDKYGFSIRYSSDFGFDTNIEHVRGLSYIPVCDEKMVACVYLSKDKYPGTNFDGAGVSVNMLNTELRQSWTDTDCYNFKVATNSAQTQVSDVTINGVVFKSATGGDAGAGHSEQVQVYRNFHNGLCYEISQHVGSTSIGNYPEGTVTQFNQDQVWEKLLGVVNTFTFTNTAQAQNPGSNQITITGSVVCLPHKNVKPGDPQTMECAIGVKDDKSGKYYSLKNNSTPIFDTGAKVEVKGTLAADSSIYDVVGAIEVVSLVKK